MKETYTKLRWKKVNKFIAIIVLTFIVLHVFLVIVYNLLMESSRKLINEDTTVQVSFCADSVELEPVFFSKGKSAYHVYIYKDSQRYYFNIEWFPKYSFQETKDRLSNKKLYITCERYSDDGSIAIYGISSDETVFYTVEDYVARQKNDRILVVILMIILEISSICIMIQLVYSFLNSDEGKYFIKKMRQRKYKKNKGSVLENNASTIHPNIQNTSLHKLKYLKRRR